MIRFNCPNCSRSYELPNAMAHLSLMCKGCGQSLAVPEPTPDPKPEPPKPKVELPRIVAPPRPVDPPRVPTPAPIPTKAIEPVASKPADDDLLFEKPDPLAELEPEVPAAKRAAEPKPAPEPSQPGGSKLVAVVVDVGIGLILIVVGVLLGELVAKKSTRDVLSEAGSAAKFPPIDLLMWMAPLVLFGLVYVFLAGRGKTLGGWLRRRSAA